MPAFLGQVRRNRQGTAGPPQSQAPQNFGHLGVSYSRRITIVLAGANSIAETSDVAARFPRSADLNRVGIGRVLGGRVNDHVLLKRSALDKAPGLIVVSSCKVQEHAHEAVGSSVIVVQGSGDPAVAVETFARPRVSLSYTTSRTRALYSEGKSQKVGKVLPRVAPEGRFHCFKVPVVLGSMAEAH